MAAAAIEDILTPKNVPIEHEIAIDEKLIIYDFKVSSKKYWEGTPIVKMSIMSPIVNEIIVAISKHK